VFLARALAQELRWRCSTSPPLIWICDTSPRSSRASASCGPSTVSPWSRRCHDLNAAALYADRVLLLKDGIAMGWGAPEEVLTEDKLREVYD
jgi:hypothetical protein